MAPENFYHPHSDIELYQIIFVNINIQYHKPPQRRAKGLSGMTYLYENHSGYTSGCFYFQVLQPCSSPGSCSCPRLNTSWSNGFISHPFPIWTADFSYIHVDFLDCMLVQYEICYSLTYRPAEDGHPPIAGFLATFLPIGEFFLATVWGFFSN